ncbi:MAG: dihydrofolate reductase [Planctomycetota bacterium]
MTNPATVHPDLALIAAMTIDRVIGKDGGLPWSLPDDMAHFKRTTTGSPIIMGRRTFETDSGVLPNRLNIVLTRQHDWSHKGVETAGTIEQAASIARRHQPDRTAYVIGGGRVYGLALPLVETMHLTVVHARVEGDTRFPAYDRAEFKLARAVRHAADTRHPHAFTILTLRRR